MTVLNKYDIHNHIYITATLSFMLTNCLLNAVLHYLITHIIEYIYTIYMQHIYNSIGFLY